MWSCFWPFIVLILMSMYQNTCFCSFIHHLYLEVIWYIICFVHIITEEIPEEILEVLYIHSRPSLRTWRQTNNVKLICCQSNPSVFHHKATNFASGKSHSDAIIPLCSNDLRTIKARGQTEEENQTERKNVTAASFLPLLCSQLHSYIGVARSREPQGQTDGDVANSWMNYWSDDSNTETEGTLTGLATSCCLISVGCLFVCFFAAPAVAIFTALRIIFLMSFWYFLLWLRVFADVLFVCLFYTQIKCVIMMSKRLRAFLPQLRKTDFCSL